MQKPGHVLDIFLQPGELYFGDRDIRIRTVLGSCVSLTFWHPSLLVGGMCHYMLPNRSHEKRAASDLKLDGRYADEAIELLNNEIKATGAPSREFVVKVFGGGNMFPDRSNPVSHVGLKNVETARKLVTQHGYNCVAEHMGGDGHRNIIFEVWSGHVWVKHAPLARQDIPGQKNTNTLQQRHDNQPPQDRRMQCAAFA
jgi:chemotaxis protein CheD